jgi:2-hydroxy-3-keto-5-methylthiopentenyl-1-phosphate phosphatase
VLSHNRFNPDDAPFGSGAPLVIMTDFDATITAVDIGDQVIDRLAPLAPDAVRRLASGNLTPRQIWEETIPRALRQPDALAALAGSAAIDPAFPAFVQWCRAAAIPLAVVSDGFRFYIEPILERCGLSGLTVFCNETRGSDLQWPNGNPYCDHCGCCKAQIVRRARAAGSRVIYVGDGTSDFYAACQADWVFARATLERYVREQGSPYFPFPGFAYVREVIARHLEAFRAGTMADRVHLRTELCRFA